MSETGEHTVIGSSRFLAGLAERQGLQFGVAQRLDEVMAAWELVYSAYTRAGLITPNPYRVHTAPQAVGGDSVVITGWIGHMVVSTLSVVLDGEGGLPLDRVYQAELDELRSQNKRIVEIGLFADRRRELARTTEALLELMRYVFHLGVQEKVTDYLMGVHPRHARFYSRTFGFKIIGEPRTYAAVNGRPVVMMCGDFAGRFDREWQDYPVYRYFLANEVGTEVFRSRYRFDPGEVAGTRIDQFLQWLDRQPLAERAKITVNASEQRVRRPA